MRHCLVLTAAVFFTGLLAVSTCSGCGSTSKTPTEEQVGGPVYPGAVVQKTSEEGGVPLVSILYAEAPTPTVIEWYRSQLSGKPDFVEDSPESAKMSGQPYYASFKYKSGADRKVVIVCPADSPGKTAITISKEFLP